MKIDNKKFCRIIRIFFLFVVFAIVFHQGYSFSEVEGDSMDPTFKDGQRLLVDEWTYKFFNPERGEIIILKDPEKKGEELVKRVIATGGDTIQIKYGKIFLNDSEIKDSFSDRAIIFYVNEEMTLWFNENEKKIKIPKGYVWVIGDNRGMSWYGIVEISEIQGKVLR